jgi:hypothetical protein
MRKHKAMGGLLLLVFAAFAVAASNASAVEFLGTFPNPVLKSTNKTEFKLVDKENGLTIKSPEQHITGSLLKNNLLDITVDFLKSTTTGLPVNSLGDSSGVILVNLTGVPVVINKGTKDCGILFTLPSKLHLEVPSVGELIEVEGTVVGLVEPNGKSKVFSVKFPETTPLVAEGGKDELKQEVEHNGKPLQGVESGTFSKVELEKESTFDCP